MKSYRVRVNGKVYEVSVEETSDLEAAAVAEPVKTAVASEKGPVVNLGPITDGDIPVNAPLSGTILSVKVKLGEEVKSGQVLLTLEALKMENEIVAPAAGIVKELVIQAGMTVNVGDVLLVLRNS